MERGRGRGGGYGGNGRDGGNGGGYGRGRGRGARGGDDYRRNNHNGVGYGNGEDHRRNSHQGGGYGGGDDHRRNSHHGGGYGGGDDHRRNSHHGGGYGGGDDQRRNSHRGGGYGGGVEREQSRASWRNNAGSRGDRYESREEQPRAARRNHGGDDRAPDRSQNPLSENPRPPRRSEANDRSPPQAVAERVKEKQSVVPSAPAELRKAVSDSFDSGKQMVKDVKQLSPVQRPDEGGSTSVQSVKLRTNHFLVNYMPDTIIMHYDVDVKPVTPPKPGRSVKIPKSDLSMIRNKLFSDNPSQFPLSHTAYDGEKNIFSAVQLPTGKFKVDISKGEDSKVCSFTFTIKLVNELKLSKLTEYLRGCASSIPRDILQGMDLVMKENPTREMISVGRNFYPRVPDSKDDLGHGISGFRGFQHSLKPTSQGLSLCLDYSVLAFHKRLPVLEFLSQHISGFSVNEFGRFRNDVYNALEGLKVYVKHRRTSQKFVVRGLTKTSARDSSFTLEDPDGIKPPRRVLLVEYFREKYDRTIVHVNLPCLDLGKPNKRNDVPMEFCEIVEGQRFHKEKLDRDAAQRFKAQSLPPPHERRGMICSMVQSRIGPCGGGIAKNFGIDVNMNMTSVDGRVIGPPQLKLGGPKGNLITVSVDGDKCQWNLVGKSVVKGKPVDTWAVLDFSQNERGYNRFGLDPKVFIPKLIARCDKLGIRMAEPLFYEPTSMRKFSSVDLLQELLECVSERAYKCSGGRLQLLVCVMAKRDPGYKYLKWICETKIGIVTQCCLSNLANKANDQFLANLGMKINAKLGGSNVELNRLPISVGTGHVMFVGADVNHPPSRNETSPSIAALVGTVNWPASNRYAGRVRAQRHRCERILDFGNMCLDLVEAYARLNKVRPEKLIIFRDGVSENQFDMVLNEEFIDLKRAFATINYSPTITVIVAQKRHQTRLFPLTREDGSSTGNVPPGTVVDTKIVHPFEFDFYLCSHYGSLGTSKPTHYHVLYDEHGFSSDLLQKLIYDMCFTMARCTKPVSLVPPVYYADLAAYRGRLYHESVMDVHSPPSGGSSSSSVTSFEERHFKLHSEVENEMFFI